MGKRVQKLCSVKLIDYFCILKINYSNTATITCSKLPSELSFKKQGNIAELKDAKHKAVSDNFYNFLY